MTEIVNYPSWHDKARAAYATGGKTQNQIADEFGFPASRTSHILGASWKLYTTLYRAPLKSRVEPGVIKRRIEEGYYKFVPVPTLSPAEVERNKAPKKIVKRFEDIDMPRTRTFIETKDFVDGKAIKKHTIKCCKCGATETYFNNAGTVSTEHLPKEFGRKGWFVGNNERTDTCPSCLKAKRGPKPKQETPIMQPEVLTNGQPVLPPIVGVPTEGPAVMKVFAETPKAEPVKTVGVDLPKIPERAMDRTERRLIFARLNELYIDETKGYSGDWTDAKVAEDLGVALAWVEEVREADFGPEINASIVDERLKEIMAIGEAIERRIVLVDKKLEQLQQLDDKVSAAVENINSAIDRFDELRKSLETEDKHIEGLLTAFNNDAKEFQEKFSAFKASSLQK